MMEPVCPQCGRDFVQRTHRQSLLEQLLSIAYVYPFRCQLCTHRFRAMQWGIRYVREAIDKRQYQRIATEIPVTFTGDQIEGTGVVKDISMGGCGLETEAQLSAGALLQLRLRISDQEPPVTVDAAAVRIVRSRFIGAQFLRLRPQEKDRLSQFIRELLIVARR